MIFGDAGDDNIKGGSGDDEIDGGAGDDVIDGGSGIDVLDGGEGNDRLTSSDAEFDRLIGGAGDDILTANNGRYSLTGDIAGTDYIAGNDQITLTNGASYSSIDGSGGDDVITASGSGYISVNGADGDDTIKVSGFTSGSILMGSGTDLVSVSNGSFNIYFSSGSVGGGGSMLKLTSIGPGSLNLVTFRAGEEGSRVDLSIFGADPFGTGALVASGGSGSAVIEHPASGMRIIFEGVPLNDLSAYNLGIPNPAFAPTGRTIEADEPDEDFRLMGADGDDVIRSFDGNDWLRGAGGKDLLDAGSGNDLLNGGTGADEMRGGKGDDRYIVDNGRDEVVELAGEGNDIVEASATFSLGAAEVETLILTGTANIGGIGSNTANRIVGNAGANRLEGGGGDDVLDGGAGADIMQGGVGNDRFVVDNAGDKIIELNGQGGDTVDASVTFSLAGQYLEALNLIGTAAINGSGNSLDNRIIGNSAANALNGAAGNDRLDGGAGADKLIGGIGNDVFVVDNAGDVIVENNGEGTDTVEASISYSIAGQYIETLKLTGTANINATGNGQANTLTGNSGNNTLNGGGGADTMAGGAGNDRYIVDNVGDKVSELTGEGIDTVEASVTFTIAGQHIEELRLTGTAAIDGTGNTLANTLWGNSAANKLNGSTGDDALHGGLGSDTLTGGSGLDHFWFETALGANNIDTISDFKAADDTIDLDRSIFTGIAADGALAAGAFRFGTTAVDADDRILYDKATGSIWYDADGAGGAAAVLFAKVTANTVLTAADFFASL